MPMIPKNMLKNLQRETFDFFIDQINPDSGLIADSTEPGAPSSIAAVGMGLTSYIVAVERKFLTRQNALLRCLKIAKFFADSVQSEAANATGYKGFYYHFIDMQSGRRSWDSELSTIDTAFLMAGFLTVARYFSGSSKEEKELTALVDSLYRRVDWQWALNGSDSICHGWSPEKGFIHYHWNSKFSEAILLYVLALGSPTFPIAPECYLKWTKTFEFKKFYDYEYIFAGPLFIHQFSHMWINFKGIRDQANEKYGLDYFENSRRATLTQQAYAIDNPLKFSHYGKYTWGFTASDGPGSMELDINGKKRTFYDYIARGAPGGPDDGTVSPWAVVASLPFADDIVLDTINHAIEKLNLKNHRLYGFDASFNFDFPDKSKNALGWVSPWRFGLNQGPIVIMIENYLSQLIWNTFQKIPEVILGLKRAGFKGSYLD
jgi:hypothetical protein